MKKNYLAKLALGIIGLSITSMSFAFYYLPLNLVAVNSTNGNTLSVSFNVTHGTSNLNEVSGNASPTMTGILPGQPGIATGLAMYNNSGATPVGGLSVEVTATLNGYETVQGTIFSPDPTARNAFSITNAWGTPSSSWQVQQPLMNPDHTVQCSFVANTGSSGPQVIVTCETASSRAH